MRAEVATDLRTIFNAPDRVSAENYLQRTVQKHVKAASKLAAWLESDLPEGFTVFGFPKAHQWQHPCHLGTAAAYRESPRARESRDRTAHARSQHLSE